MLIGKIPPSPYFEARRILYLYLQPRAKHSNWPTQFSREEDYNNETTRSTPLLPVSTGKSSIQSTCISFLTMASFGELVLVLGDLHIPQRANMIPEKFKRYDRAIEVVLVPGLCTEHDCLSANLMFPLYFLKNCISNKTECLYPTRCSMWFVQETLVAINTMNFAA